MGFLCKSGLFKERNKRLALIRMLHFKLLDLKYPPEPIVKPKPVLDTCEDCGVTFETKASVISNQDYRYCRSCRIGSPNTLYKHIQSKSKKHYSKTDFPIKGSLSMFRELQSNKFTLTLSDILLGPFAQDIKFIPERLIRKFKNNYDERQRYGGVY